jgi:hypothetical protein
MSFDLETSPSLALSYSSIADSRFMGDMVGIGCAAKLATRDRPPGEDTFPQQVPASFDLWWQSHLATGLSDFSHWAW